MTGVEEEAEMVEDTRVEEVCVDVVLSVEVAVTVVRAAEDGDAVPETGPPEEADAVAGEEAPTEEIGPPGTDTVAEVVPIGDSVEERDATGEVTNVLETETVTGTSVEMTAVDEGVAVSVSTAVLLTAVTSVVAVVAVCSDGTVVTLVASVDEMEVVGITIVAFVVGDSVVETTVLVTSDSTVVLVVAVLSEGTVVTLVTSADEIRVVGITTVALVVGGSVVDVAVSVTSEYAVVLVVAVRSLGMVSVAVTSPVEISVVGITTVALVVGGSVVDVDVSVTSDNTVVPVVAVLSLGIVSVAVTSAVEMRVEGMTTVALVVGGSVVDV